MMESKGGNMNNAKKCKKAILVFFFIFSLFQTLTTPAFAQGVNQAQPAMSGPRKQLATIIFAGLGGAILGLSTLSFYGRPQDHLENIALGFVVIIPFVKANFNSFKRCPTIPIHQDKLS